MVARGNRRRRMLSKRLVALAGAGLGFTTAACDGKSPMGEFGNFVAVITGTVTTDAGTPVGGARVVVQLDAMCLGTQTSIVAADTDSTGLYRLVVTQQVGSNYFDCTRGSASAVIGGVRHTGLASRDTLHYFETEESVSALRQDYTIHRE